MTERECIYLLKGIMCRRPVAEGGLLLCEEHAGLLQRPEDDAPPTCGACGSEEECGCGEERECDHCGRPVYHGRFCSYTCRRASESDHA